MFDATADPLGSRSVLPSSAHAIATPSAKPEARVVAAPGALEPTALQPFLRTLSHELRNVMGTIAISVEVLRTGAGGEEASDSALQILGRQNTRLEGVMATALELARALEGGALLSLRPVALGDLLAEVIRQLAPHGPRLSLRKTPLAWVEADPVYLSQAIRSLVAATLPSRSDDSGEPIEAWVEVAASQDDWVVRFAAHAAELDVPWVRLRAPTMLPPPRSPGLDGLLAHQLLLLHHGSLHIAYPHGSGFTLVLPRAARP